MEKETCEMFLSGPRRQQTATNFVRHIQTDKQKDRQTKRLTDKQTDRQQQHQQKDPSLLHRVKISAASWTMIRPLSQMPSHYSLR